MKFWEAMKALEEGKKVRKVCWGVQGGHISSQTIKSDGLELGKNTLEANWEILPEPKLVFSKVLPAGHYYIHFFEKEIKVMSAENAASIPTDPVPKNYVVIYAGTDVRHFVIAGRTLEDFKIIPVRYE